MSPVVAEDLGCGVQRSIAQESSGSLDAVRVEDEQASVNPACDLRYPLTKFLGRRLSGPSANSSYQAVRASRFCSIGKGSWAPRLRGCQEPPGTFRNARECTLPGGPPDGPTVPVTARVKGTFLAVSGCVPGWREDTRSVYGDDRMPALAVKSSYPVASLTHAARSS